MKDMITVDLRYGGTMTFRPTVIDEIVDCRTHCKVRVRQIWYELAEKAKVISGIVDNAKKGASKP